MGNKQLQVVLAIIPPRA